jgi:hypothetical protein
MAKQIDFDKLKEILGSDEAFDIVYSYGDGGADEVLYALRQLIERQN